MDNFYSRSLRGSCEVKLHQTKKGPCRESNCSSSCCCSKNQKKFNHSCCPTNPTANILFSINPPTLCSSNSGNNTGFISGQVFVNGRPAEAGVIVSLSVSNPSLGILIPAATITNETGHFTGVFIATNGPGTGSIIATLPGCPGTIASIPITIEDCSQPTATINNFNASLNTICTTGTGPNMSNLSGQVFVNGSPAGGVTVQFQVNPNNLGSVNPSSTTTDASGNFNVVFTANNTTGTANITATLPSFGTNATTSININNCQPIATINNFNASPNTICATGTGSPNTSNLSGQVFVNGSPAGGVTVQFQVNDNNLGSVNPSSTTTDASGNFNVVFTANNTTGTANITASLPSFGTNAPTSITINDCDG